MTRKLTLIWNSTISCFPYFALFWRKIYQFSRKNLIIHARKINPDTDTQTRKLCPSASRLHVILSMLILSSLFSTNWSEFFSYALWRNRSKKWSRSPLLIRARLFLYCIKQRSLQFSRSLPSLFSFPGPTSLSLHSSPTHLPFPLWNTGKFVSTNRLNMHAIFIQDFTIRTCLRLE